MPSIAHGSIKAHYGALSGTTSSSNRTDRFQVFGFRPEYLVDGFYNHLKVLRLLSLCSPFFSLPGFPP